GAHGPPASPTACPRPSSARYGRRRWPSASCSSLWRCGPVASLADKTAVGGAVPGLGGLPFALALIAVAVVIFAFGRWLDSSYAFFIGYIVVQYIVLGTAWNILAGYTGHRDFDTTPSFAIGAYSTVALHKL